MIANTLPQLYIVNLRNVARCDLQIMIFIQKYGFVISFWIFLLPLTFLPFFAYLKWKFLGSLIVFTVESGILLIYIMFFVDKTLPDNEIPTHIPFLYILSAGAFVATIPPTLAGLFSRKKD